MNKLLNIFRDSSWQSISFFASTIFSIVTILISLQTTQNKSIQIVVLSSLSAVEIDNSVQNKIRITYEDNAITNLSIFTVRLENNGNQSVKPEDYIEPITLTFPQEATVTEASIIESSPTNVGLSVSYSLNKVVLSKTLLNSGDKVIIRFTVTNMPVVTNDLSVFRLESRIVDVSRVDLVRAIDSDNNVLLAAYNIVTGLTGAIIATIAIAILGIMGMRGKLSPGFILLVIFGIALMFGARPIAELISGQKIFTPDH